MTTKKQTKKKRVTKLPPPTPRIQMIKAYARELMHDVVNDAFNDFDKEMDADTYFNLIFTRLRSEINNIEHKTGPREKAAK